MERRYVVRAVVVYESLWGNTAAVARAIAEGIGLDVPALTTSEMTAERLESVDLLVVGSPVLGFMLPTKTMLGSIAGNPAHKEHPPDVPEQPLRAWLDALPRGHGHCAAFETRISWSPRGAVSDIAKRLKRKGYTPIGEPGRFLVTGTYGPLVEGEIERARAWGVELAASGVRPA